MGSTPTSSINETWIVTSWCVRRSDALAQVPQGNHTPRWLCKSEAYHCKRNGSCPQCAVIPEGEFALCQPPQSAEEGCEDVHLDGLLSGSLRDSDALRKVPQHLGAMSRRDVGEDDAEEADGGLDNEGGKRRRFSVGVATTWAGGGVARRADGGSRGRGRSPGR